ncbi:YncE family protein [Sorangium sp. So ce1097]|uniref:YncE family protein n=1 Tax=Sorangium sp. So ce1097 TaxID=3133330 RepID=UPI003F5D6B25
MLLSRFLGCALAAATLASCGEPDPIIETHYEAYEGDAYPNRRPKIVIPEGGMAVVSDSRSDTFSLISLATGERFGVHAVGRDPVTIDGPHHVVVDRSRKAFYTALSYPSLIGAVGPHASHGSSVMAGYVQKLALDDMRPLGQVRVEANPGDIVISEDGSRLVVSHFDLQRAIKNAGDVEAARSSIVVIDPDEVLPSGSPEPVRIPVCITAHGVALSRPDGARAYVACYGEDVLTVVDLTDPTAEVERVPVGPSPAVFEPSYGPYAAVMSPDQKTIAVSNVRSKDVRFFDVESGEFRDPDTIATLFGSPYFVAWSPDSSRIYVPMQAPDAITVIDVAAGNTALAYRDLSQVCDRPHIADLDGTGALFVVCEGDQIATPGRVLRLDPETLETLSDAEVGLYPDAFVRVPAEAP